MTNNAKKNIVIKKPKKPNQRLKKHRLIFATTLKIFLIAFLIYGFYLTSASFSNSIPLLAVNQDDQGNSHGGSVINLYLTVKPGSGQIHVNLNTLEEIDTQISIINSQKIACNLFELDCENYDFYYEFDGSALVLKGPSASSAIAILTAKTLKKEKINNKVAMTGSLNSGGIVGTVGGVDQKIKTAQEEGFKKVIIPLNSEYNGSVEYEIEIVKALDIIEAYNNFNGYNYKLKTYEIDKTSYENFMRSLAENICLRADEIKFQTNLEIINQSSSEYQYKLNALKSLNSSQTALENKNYYSQGSFCYNANLNLRALSEIQKNITEDKMDSTITQLESQINSKYVQINSQDYKNNITTINDFYVYLLLNDRLEESKEFLKQIKEPQINIQTSNQTNISSNITITPKNNLRQKEILYSYALERFYTVELWEKFIKHSGEKITFSDKTINDACMKINRDLSIKSELLQNYGFTFFESDIENQQSLSSPFSNKYLCVYKGLELSGRINTVLNSVGITQEQYSNFTKDIIDLTTSRISLNSKGNFPLIPYIYYEYANDLYKQEDYSSATLYSNYALAYSDLNLFLEKQEKTIPVINAAYNELMGNIWFIVTILFIIAFVK